MFVNAAEKLKNSREFAVRLEVLGQPATELIGITYWRFGEIKLGFSSSLLSDNYIRTRHTLVKNIIGYIIDGALSMTDHHNGHTYLFSVNHTKVLSSCLTL